MDSKKPPPLNFIRSFEASARHLSFTTAAAELGRTQAAISMHIRSLERVLGVELFVRHARSLALTEAGAAYLPTLRQALMMIDTATQTVQINTAHKTVRIAAPMSLAENWLAPRIAAYAKDNEDVQFIVYGTVWEEDVPDSDITVYMGRLVENRTAMPLFDQSVMGVLCGPDTAASITTPEDVAKAPKIIVAGRQEYWTETAARLGLSIEEMNLKGSIRVNASNIALDLVSHGAGLVAVPLETGETYIQRGLLVEPIQVRVPSPWGYFVKPLSDKALSSAQDVLQHLRQPQTQSLIKPVR